MINNINPINICEILTVCEALACVLGYALESDLVFALQAFCSLREELELSMNNFKAMLQVDLKLAGSSVRAQRGAMKSPWPGEVFRKDFAKKWPVYSRQRVPHWLRVQQ